MAINRTAAAALGWQFVSDEVLYKNCGRCNKFHLAVKDHEESAMASLDEADCQKLFDALWAVSKELGFKLVMPKEQ